MATENDVMISYQWDSKEEIIKLVDELRKKGLKVWIDDTHLCPNVQPLTEQLGKFFNSINIQFSPDQLNEKLLHFSIENGIRNSAKVLCFITQKYLDSSNCRLEIHFAHALGKPMIICMGERILISNLKSGGIAPIIA